MAVNIQKLFDGNFDFKRWSKVRHADVADMHENAHVHEVPTTHAHRCMLRIEILCLRSALLSVAVESSVRKA